ncbi:MAG TPA: AmmeMemoRadiSam system radical SAM enzyme [Pirellulales bacterium]|nr:AmmeMemoRadiSam system radical SAM enzyme [Pirellulales bacterium]
MSSVLLPPAGLRPDGTKSGGWWHAADEPGRIVCDLCPRACALRPGDRGFCFVRENREGDMVLSTYGRSTGFCIDPIEKKPLNHFYPGTSVLSFGTAGCNLGCKFCQNWSISKSREIERLSEEATPEAIAEAARRLGCRSVAFTYNDPVIWAEYAIDVAKACRDAGIKTVAVTAGYITPVARGPFYEVMDAANVDLKAFTEEFYRHQTLSHLQPVLDTLRWLKHETNVWFEVTNLVIPRANDSRDEFKQMCQWVLENLGPEVPLHFTAFHPDFRMMDRGPTPPETLLAAREIAVSLGIHYAYAGNVHSPREGSTWCPGCGQLLIERDWYDLGKYELAGDRCGGCGYRIAGHFESKPGNWGRKRLPVRIADFAPAGQRPFKNFGEPTMSETSTAGELLQIALPVARPGLTDAENQGLLRAAARVVAATARGRPITPVEAGLSAFERHQIMGAFVTLKRNGRLRSCCGSMSQSMSLAQAVFHAACRSAADDHRFPPVSPSELPYLEIDVWVLFGERRCEARGEARREGVVVGRHGLIIARGAQRGLLLPGVAVDHGLDADGFLQQVCLKAGLPPTAWKDEDTELSLFEGEMTEGMLAEMIDAKATAPQTPAVSDGDLQSLAEFCRGNIFAALTGATPSFYAFGVSDANVNGVAVALEDAAGNPWVQADQLSFRKPIPLQATLYALAEHLGRAIGQGQIDPRHLIDPRRLAHVPIHLSVLFDPAMHGTLAQPDVRGFDAARRAMVVVEGDRSAIVWNQQGDPEAMASEAARLARVTTPEAASLYSFSALSNGPRMSVANVQRPQAGPNIRPAAVAGSFYPSDAGALSRLVDELVAGDAPPPEPWPAVMVPHAGLMYSGRLAADVLRRVVIPESVIVIGPKHTRLGVDWSVAPHEAWSIPGATLAADPELARALVEAIPGLELDAAAHQQEHAIEVELPLLARLAPHARVTGIAIGSGNLTRCRAFAQGLANCLRERRQPTLLVISSDMNHFASDAENRRLDELALAAIETLDPAELYETVTRHHISMCGVLPAVIVMETLKQLGVLDECRRVGYATSGDMTGDRSRVVGYAGMLLGHWA